MILNPHSKNTQERDRFLSNYVYKNCLLVNLQTHYYILRLDVFIHTVNDVSAIDIDIITTKTSISIKAKPITTKADLKNKKHPTNNDRRITKEQACFMRLASKTITVAHQHKRADVTPTEPVHATPRLSYLESVLPIPG